METIREEFECQVCLNYMVPPIRLCKEGHSYCDRCDKFLEQCPMCRAPKLNVRNQALEAMFQNLMVPCAADGCESIIRWKHWKLHRQCCNYVDNIDCLLKEMENCSWKGSNEDMMEHCLQSHKLNAFKSSNANILYQGVINKKFVGKHNCELECYHILMQCYGEIFKCVWDVDTCTGLMRWAVYRVNSQSDTEYKFYVSFRNIDSPVYPPLVISADCKVQQSNDSMDDFVFVSVHCISLCMLTGKNGIYYTISIRKSYESKPARDIYLLNKFFIPKASSVLSRRGVNTGHPPGQCGRV